MPDSPAAERVLDEESVSELVASTAPAWATLPLRLVAQGWDNAIWRLGDSLVVRLPRRAASATLIPNERRALDVIAPLLHRAGIAAPRHLITGEPHGSYPWPWAILPWIEGRSALEVPRPEAAGSAAALAAALLAMHVPAPDDVAVNPFRGVPLRERDRAMRSQSRTHPAQHAIRDAWQEGIRADAATERVWIHGDLHPGNVIFHDGALTGLIDFGDTTAGDPAYDLAAAWLLFDSDGRAEFRSATGGRYDESTWIRARAWAGYLALVLLTRSDDRPDLLRVGQETARELSRATD